MISRSLLQLVAWLKKRRDRWQYLRLVRAAHARLTMCILETLRSAEYQISRQPFWLPWGSPWRFLSWERCGPYAIAHIRDGPWLNAADQLCVVDLDFECLMGATPPLRRITRWYVSAHRAELLLTIHRAEWLTEDASGMCQFRFRPGCHMSLC